MKGTKIMLTQIKNCLVIAAVSFGSVVVSYGVCDYEKFGEQMDAFEKSFEREAVCCLKVMIGHHRKHGITPENKARLLAAAQKLGAMEDEESLSNFEKHMIEGIYVVEDSNYDDKGTLLSVTKKLVPFEEEEAEILKTCNEFEQLNYEAALNRFIELLDGAYRECERLTMLANTNAEL